MMHRDYSRFPLVNTLREIILNNRYLFQAHLISFLKECASRNTNAFSDRAGHLSADEILVIQRAVGSN